MLTELEKQYAADDGSEFHLSFNKISKKKIKDMIGYVSTEYGDPTFQISYILFEDGSKQYVEGEHDFPYLIDYDGPTQEVLDKLSKEGG